MEDLIAFIACSLVDHPEAVHVRRVDRDGPPLYELKVTEEDRGRVIGKDGQTIEAIRILLKAAAASEQKPMLEIVD